MKNETFECRHTFVHLPLTSPLLSLNLALYIQTDIIFLHPLTSKTTAVWRSAEWYFFILTPTHTTHRNVKCLLKLRILQRISSGCSQLFPPVHMVKPRRRLSLSLSLSLGYKTAGSGSHICKRPPFTGCYSEEAKQTGGRLTELNIMQMRPQIGWIQQVVSQRAPMAHLLSFSAP